MYAWRNRQKRFNSNTNVHDLEAPPSRSGEASVREPGKSPLRSKTISSVHERVEKSVNESKSYSPLIIASASKSFGNHIAITDISMSVKSGEIFALLGPNGAGKTTLINCVLGLYRLSSGTAKIGGFDIVREHDQVYRHIGICPQNEILWPDLTPEEHLLFFCRLKGVDPKQEKETVRLCLERMELIQERGKLAKELSGGQRRRLCLAIALVGAPAVVFLDEPTTGNSHLFTLTF
jgi:ABC-type Na+ transport system ATPase subunit NatA